LPDSADLEGKRRFSADPVAACKNYLTVPRGIFDMGVAFKTRSPAVLD
jgi:hypothetical protein